MGLNWTKRIFNSVFTKLLAVILISGMVITLMVAGFFKTVIYKIHRDQYQKNIISYIHYLVQDLGDPPRLEKARLITQRAGIAIEYEGPDRHWSTLTDPKPDQFYHLHIWQKEPLIRGKVFRGNYYVEAFLAQGRFTFVLEREKPIAVGRFALYLIGFLILAFSMIYLVIRKILSPINDLSQGVKQVGLGNLDHLVPVKKSDELGQLADAFNQMILRIKNMLDAKEQLLLDVSHELRSPLTRMRVALEFLDEGKAKQRLKADILEMEQMIMEILETAKIANTGGYLDIKALSLSQLMGHMKNLYTDQGPGITIENMTDDLVIHADEKQINTVLNNIITNALKYSDSKGPQVVVRAERKETYTVIAIKDFGTGIDPKDLPYIFEPFYRADRSRNRQTGGYGLGLSLCKAIMEAHQGKIEIESSPGQFTQVSLYFPIVMPT